MNQTITFSTNVEHSHNHEALLVLLLVHKIINDEIQYMETG